MREKKEACVRQLLSLKRALLESYGRFTSRDAQRLIEKFPLVRAIANGSLIEAEVRMPSIRFPGREALPSHQVRDLAEQLDAACKGEARLPENAPMTLGQLDQLEHCWMQQLKGIDVVSLVRLKLHDHMIDAIARGEYVAAMFVRERRTIVIDWRKSLWDRFCASGCVRQPPHLEHLEDVHRYEAEISRPTRAVLELVSFAEGCATKEAALRMLEEHGLRPATIEHLLAYVAACPAHEWPHDGIDTIVAAGSGTEFHGTPATPMLRVPDGNRRERWELDHLLDTRGERQFHARPAHGSWLLAVAKEEAI